MQFLTNVDKKKIRDAWDDGMRKNMSTQEFSNVKEALAKLKNATPNLRKDDHLSFTMNKSNFIMHYNNKEVLRMDNEHISKSFLKIFLGNNPPNEELKQGLLGN